MSTERNPDPVILLFAIAVIVAAFAAFVTTFERVGRAAQLVARLPPGPRGWASLGRLLSGHPANQ